MDELICYLWQNLLYLLVRSVIQKIIEVTLNTIFSVTNFIVVKVVF